ncbi:MAG: aminoglycoside phosphotransferase family protein [Anaerolineae bacterium]|jgi:aminoglycoside phosphotransferase (APT) family kinase protein|nr:aminoglycoside phosphotransferase family protein [Anaerolineae bacterium]
MPYTRQDINAELVRRLIAAQFPHWAHLPIRPVDLDGWDNRTFRLGDDMSVRLPSAARYVAQVEKEQRWLPKLAPLLPLPIPVPLEQGVPAAGYPWSWSIYRWLGGEPATVGRVRDLSELATTLGRFLFALQGIDPTGGPAAGPHSFYRGGPLSTYDAETRNAISALHGRIDAEAATEVWEAALNARWDGASVWVHGDVATGNLLVKNGCLSAVIDFGCSAVGDPACDTAIAWTLFSGESREAFRGALSVDSAIWARGRGWALWKALITVAGHIENDALKAAEAQRVIDEVVSDHERA